jgi:hypothetical protein
MERHVAQDSPPSTVVVTGTNAAYADFAVGTIRSLAPARARYEFRLIVLDFGLTKEQQRTLEALEAELVEPRWCFNVPETMRTHATLAAASRLALPELVPGHEVYVWVDADVWAQDDRFFAEFVEPARRGELAIVHEHERVYPFDFTILRWALGNLCLSFGFSTGLNLYCQKAINAGVFALHRDALHWESWIKYYQHALSRRPRSFNQLSLYAAVYLDNLPIHYLSGAYNWVCSRACPMFDERDHSLRVPYPPFERISLVHLAGPGKRRRHRLRTLQGNHVERDLLYHQPKITPAMG